MPSQAFPGSAFSLENANSTMLGLQGRIHLLYLIIRYVRRLVPFSSNIRQSAVLIGCSGAFVNFGEKSAWGYTNCLGPVWPKAASLARAIRQ